MKRLLKTVQVFLLFYRNAALSEEIWVLFFVFFYLKAQGCVCTLLFNFISDLCQKRKVALLSLKRNPKNKSGSVLDKK